MSLILSGTDGLSDVDGSASTPAIRGTDTNTGIFFPAADTIAFTEGGVEAMRIDSSGQVGVGVTPNTWSTGKVVEVGVSGTSLWGLTSGTSYVTAGYYFNSTDKFALTGNYAMFSQLVPSDGSFRWYSSTATGTAGNNATMSERMRIDSSGNVGIGTSTPNIYSTSFARQFTASTTTASGYSVGTFAGGSGGSGGVEFGNQTVRQAGIYGLDGSALALYTNATNSGTGLTERMRITSAGRLAIGSSSTNYPLYVKLSSDSGDWFAKFENTQSSTPYGFYLQYPNAAPNGTASDFIYCADSAAARMTVRSNGGIANYSANDVNLSDEREKTNIQLAGSYLDKICAIPVKTFNYIDQNREEDDGLTLGVIAQDVQKVAPELVMESNWAAKDQPEKMRLSIYQTDLQYALMKCIQEQQAMIEELRAEVAALKSTLP